MKIAMIGHKRIPSREGGVEVVVEELSKRMVQRGHTVEAYNRISIGRRSDEKQMKLKSYCGIRLISIATFPQKQLNAVVYSLGASIRALFGRYDFIHYHAEGICYMIWLPHLFGMKTVVTVHGLDWKRAKWGGFASWFIKLGEKAAVRYADQMIVLSQDMQSYFKKEYDRETVYIPNGIVKPVAKPADQIRKKFGIEKDGYCLLVARLVPEKGIHYLIESFKKVNTNKKLMIVGDNHTGDEYVRQIEEMAQGDQRILFTGFAEGELLEELFSNAYVYILPSDIEGMPMSLLEAMSYGNCCLTSDIPENAEVVGGSGILFRKSDIGDLTQQLQRLCDNPDIVASYQQESSEAVCEKYDWEKIADQTIELYRSM